MKYYNCKADSITEGTGYDCISQKTGKCVEVCEAQSWTGCEHSSQAPNGCPAKVSTCVSDCKLDGFPANYWCRQLLAGL